MSIAPTRKTGAGSWNLDSPVRLSKGLEEGKALSKAAEKLTETIDAVVSVLDPASSKKQRLFMRCWRSPTLIGLILNFTKIDPTKALV
jgi:hypothetical protein